MEREHLNEFISLFGAIPYAEILIDGENDIRVIGQFTDYVEKHYSEITKLVAIPSQSNLVINAIEEIESNLYKYPESRITYLNRMIRSFSDIGRSLNINVKKEYEQDEDGRLYVRIGEKEYPGKSNFISHTIIERYCRWREPYLEYKNATLPEKYILGCHRVFDIFWLGLDKLCVDFGLDIMEVQANIDALAYTRENVNLRCDGYKTPQKDGGYGSESLDESNTEKHQECFRSNLSKVQLVKLFNLLSKDGYIAQNTDEASFVWAFSGEDRPNAYHPIEWIKPVSTTARSRNKNISMMSLIDLLVLISVPEDQITDKKRHAALFSRKGKPHAPSNSNLIDAREKKYRSEYHGNLKTIVEKSKA